MNRPIYGNPATTPTPVADFNQNNPNKADYIKNRPFYEEAHELGSVDGINETQIPSPVSVGDDLYVTFATVSGLFFDARIKLQEGVSEYRCCVDCVKIVFSGIWLTVYNVSKEFDLSYTGTITVSRMAITKLPDRFIPDNIKYAYESKKIGEAEADADMGTAFVICSEEIKAGDTILVKGYFNDGTTEEYTLEVPETDEGYTKIGTSDGRLGDINLPIPTTITFSCDVKGEVYKLNKKPISEMISDIDSALNRVIAKYGLDGDA